MNLVEEYLFENKNKKLSIRTLHKRLKIKKRKIYYLINQSKNIRKVNPLEVGSLKNETFVFTYNI